ncbi:Adenylyl cyclase-associated protein 1 [Camelus dromedarius]|uniref:Adenylyl cyclase-associated protein n=1 Tax=Camelus dromedarius TaxID=9838 RepID=A0A5N4DAJ1_CAMDR|nr:Adenylyl cyclase-associated protein 1 [Camelus dromedarius]
MADMQNLVERLERVVGRLEAVSSASDMHCGYGDSAAKGRDGPHRSEVGESSLGYSLSVPAASRQKKLVAEVVELCGTAGVGVLIRKNHKIQPEELELCEESEMMSSIVAYASVPNECRVRNKLSDLLAPISEQIQEVITFREKNRDSKLFNHLSAISESIQALGWVAMAPTPGPYVKEMNDTAMFYTNRVLKEYRDVDKKHVDWVKAYLSIWTELQAYIKEFHTTGLAWSKTGPVAKELSGLPSGPSAGSGPPPPPPGPPPPPVPTSSGSDDSASRSALFAQINQGESITHALKHVSDDMKTHKNPALKAQSGPVRSGPKPFSASKPGISPSPKPPTKKEPALLELEGKKWRVENQENVSNLVIDGTELKQVAYIFKCVNSTLQIKGKINSITVDNCKKLGLVFDDVVGIVEIINSKDVKVQVMGKVPTISINKTDGCHVYLSKNSLDCEIVSAKSSEMNVLIPTDGGDFNEFPVPEQFKTLWNGQKLVTTVTEIAG